MHTLLLHGSPRRNGDSAALLSALRAQLPGDAMLVSAYHDGIQPCLDCRRCWREPGCALDDRMQEVYQYLRTCDAVVIASPVYYSELSGPLLSVASRLQTYFTARRFRGEAPGLRPKHGVLLLTGGEPGTEARAAQTAHTLFRLMHTTQAAMVASMYTNEVPAARDAEALRLAGEAGALLGQLCRHEA